MFAQRYVRPGFRLAAMLALIVISASCGKDSTEPEEGEPSTTQVRITAGSVTQTFGTQGGTLRVPLGATTVTATWLLVDGSSDPIANTATFRLRVTPPASGTGSNITFVNSSSNGHSGTLTVPTAVTNAAVQFELFHIAEGHSDFGPITISITAP